MGTELARQASVLLDEVLVELTDEEREETLRAPLGLLTAGPALARAAIEFPDLAKRSDFDSAAVEEDLANAQALAPLAERLEPLVVPMEEVFANRRGRKAAT